MGLTTEQIAEVCHEANRVLQKHFQHSGVPVSPPWDETDEETRASARDGVSNAMLGATAKASHANWVRHRTEHGWTYGPTKDLMAKTHPLLVSWEQLPAIERLKDELFVAIVGALD